MSAAAAIRCDVCPRGCLLPVGGVGACRARANISGEVRPLNYGRLTSIALDPVEKKPLSRWKPGSSVLSLGSYGCNLRCPWCQNHEISQVGADDVLWREAMPGDVVALAERLRRKDPRTVGIAYTYNEPLVSWEFVRDCGVLAHEAGLANVLVSAGCMSSRVVQEIAPLIDAANVDLKSFRARTYESLGGSLACVRETICLLAQMPTCHLEVTTLIVPEVNDTDEEMDELSAWLASVDPEVTLHVSRFFPNWHMRDRGPTSIARVYELAKVARRHLSFVYTGNC